jgi:diadenosine tetraphosphate (Ap4A) HIT family hydrolase
MRIAPPNQSAVNAAKTAPQATATATTATTAHTGAATSSVDAMDAGPTHTAHDSKYRVGVTAVGTGATKTEVPKLMHDWRLAVVDATAEDAAIGEHQVEIDAALANAEQQFGARLPRDLRNDVIDSVVQAHLPEIQAATAAYREEFGKDKGAIDKTVRDVVLTQRPNIDRKRDPFTPVAQNDPQARAKEKVLWENANAMVLVDAFAPSPKLLVVPKAPVTFPVDAPAGMLHELALIAAHASDAFSTVSGTPPAGIWINPPQHLTVKQLHIHVMPNLPNYKPVDDGMPLSQADVQAIQAFFDNVGQALVARLGASQV